ncbi:MAG: MBL fold metallo-hydrolase [Bacillota bacterium]|nr:MBL fold metallo-hydrolase [Bacillota bacterium]
MKYRITTLLENKKKEDKSYYTEHGLSFVIETPSESIIFDTGQSDAFIRNARLMDIDLKCVNKMIISHGHYDHSGGVKPFIEKYHNNLQFFVSSHFFDKKYKIVDEISKYIGNDFNSEFLEGNGVSINLIKNSITKVSENIYVVTNFERNFLEETNEQFYIKENGKNIVDLFNDEISVVVKGEKGLVVLVGCSHPGIRNIITTVKKLFSEPILAVIGGTHLRNASDKRIMDTIEIFKELKIKKIGVSHCTGDRAVNLLKKEMPDEFFENNTGSVFEFDK